MKFYILCFLLIFLPQFAQTQALKKVKLSDGKIRMKVPANWFEMSPEDMVMRYPSIRRPIAAYTSDDRMSDLNIKISASQWLKKDIDMAQQFFKASIYNLFDRVEMKDEGLREMNGLQYILFEFESYLASGEDMPPERKYNYLLYYLGNTRTYVISFRCPEKDMENYQDMAHKIMDSIKIKGL